MCVWFEPHLTPPTMYLSKKKKIGYIIRRKTKTKKTYDRLRLMEHKIEHSK